MTFADDARDLEELDLLLASPGRPTIEVPVWVVVVDDEVIVRSYTGVGARWFRRATRHPAQSVRVGGDTIGVTFEPIESTEAIDDAYDDKYARFDYVGAMSKPTAAAATLRVVRR